MDALKKAILSSLARGIMWAAATVSAMVGVETMDESTAQGVAAWVLALALAGGGLLWSWYKNRKLLES